MNFLEIKKDLPDNENMPNLMEYILSKLDGDIKFAIMSGCQVDFVIKRETGKDIIVVARTRRPVSILKSPSGEPISIIEKR